MAVPGGFVATVVVTTRRGKGVKTKKEKKIKRERERERERFFLLGKEPGQEYLIPEF